MPKVGFAWSSSNSALATVDSVGVATAVGVGIDTVRAVGDGITGIGVLTIRALPKLLVNADTVYTGVGLDLTGFGRPFPTLTPDPADSGTQVTASLVISDTTVAKATSTLSLACCSPTAWTGVVGKRSGTTTLTVSAPDYLPAILTVRVTTPRLIASQAPGRDTVELGGYGGAHFLISDSLGDVRRVVQQTVVRIRSSDTTVLQVGDSAIVAPQDIQGSASIFARAIGSARVSFNAPGYLSDTATFHIVPGRLHFVATDLSPRHQQTLAAGADNSDDPVHLSTGVSLIDTVRATLTQRHPERVSVPPSVLLPTNTVTLVGLAPGPDTVIATASGYLPDTLTILVTPPTFLVQTLPLADRVTAFHRLSLFVADTFHVMHFPAAGVVTARVVSSDTTVLQFSQDTASIGRSTGGSNDRPIAYLVGSGTATVTVTDLGSQFVPTVIGPITVSAAPLAMAARGPRQGEKAVGLGMGQRLGFPDNLALVGFVDYGLPSPSSPVPIHLRSTNPSVAAPEKADLPSAVLGNGLATFDIIAGDTVGASWIVAEGHGLIPDSLLVTVGRPRLVIPGGLEGLETGHGTLEIQITDQDGNLRIAAEPIPVALSSTDDAIVVSDSAQVTIPQGAYHTFFDVHLRSPGTAAIRAVDPRSVPQRYDGTASGPITVIQVPTP